MKDFRTGYLYGLAPIHCGGEGDLGNVLEIAREVHTDFPYIPGSSLRGSLRQEVEEQDPEVANLLFGKKLAEDGSMGVHQVWFGDARLLWMPMRTMSLDGRTDIFTWVSCHSLIRDHAIAARLPAPVFTNQPVGDYPGRYVVADAEVTVESWPQGVEQAIALNNWPQALNGTVSPVWQQGRIVLNDADFQTLVEHALWTQIRNKIEDDPEKDTGSAEIFWTDVCIPRDTIIYFTWGYKINSSNPVTQVAHDILMDIVSALLQVGGQANVGRGWVHGWVSDSSFPCSNSEESSVEQATGVADPQPVEA